MWIVFGMLAIILTGMNLYNYKTGKAYQVVMSLALSFTALTVVAEYGRVASWVKAADWAALQDLVPTMEMVTWVFTSLLILLNVSPLILDRNKKKSVNPARFNHKAMDIK